MDTFLYTVQGEHLCADIFKTPEKIKIEVRDLENNDLVEKIYIDDQHDALEIARNATVGKG